MPIYTYICNDCNTEFDLLIGVSSEQTELLCTKCGSSRIKKTFAAFGVNVKSKTSNKTCPSGQTCPNGTCSMSRKTN